MRFDKYIENLPNGAASLFNFNLYQYPAPFDSLGIKIAKKAARDFGALKMMPFTNELELSDLQELIYDEILLNDYEIKAFNKIMNALELDDENAGFVERRTYGEAVSDTEFGAATVTNNIGARSSTDTLGATDGTTTNTDTSYESTTGKQTTTSRVQTNQIQNGSTSTAAVDSTVAAAHTDTDTKYEHEDLIERFENIGESEAPDYIAKWLKIKNAPVMVAIEKIIVDALCMPYYEED